MVILRRGLFNGVIQKELDFIAIDSGDVNNLLLLKNSCDLRIGELS